MKCMAAAAASTVLNVRTSQAAPAPLPEPSPSRLPRWRGFNLLEKFIASAQNAPFRESDFEWMAEWGFNFARLPMSYRCWSTPERWREMDEKVLSEIDQAVSWGKQYGIHVSLNFHRAPGYSVDASLAEPFNLWTDAEALEACAYHWGHFARRYRDIPSRALSFDLVNEPATLSTNPMVLLDDNTYARVARELVKAIRAESPQRLIIADGLLWGNVPVPALADLKVGQSTRGYAPMEVTHWKADWVAGSSAWPEPRWPFSLTPEAAEAARRDTPQFLQAFKDNPILGKIDRSAYDPGADWNKDRFIAQQIRPWKELEAMGVGVHVGEFGVFRHTPHPVALAWMGDVLSCWKEAGWGWALWNLRGPFGVVDSGRTDVAYEAFRGHQLDRGMLDLLRAS